MNSKLALRAAVLLVIGVTTVLIAVQPPAWIVLPFGSPALAVLINSRYDPLDPRFVQLHPTDFDKAERPKLIVQPMAGLVSWLREQSRSRSR